MDGLSGAPSFVMVLFLLFMLVLSIVWILLPFAVFGIKERLDRIIVAQGKTNAELWELRAAMSRQGATGPSPTAHEVSPPIN